MTRYSLRLAVRRMARKLVPKKRVLRSLTVASSKSISNYARTLTTFSRLAILLVSQCWHTKQSTKVTSLRKLFPVRKHYFDPKVIPSIAYTDPEVAWAGLTEKEAKEQGIAIETAVFPWSASGRAIASGATDGFTKLIFDKETHRILGGAMVGAHAGELLGEICLAVEMGADAEDIALTVHAHPTLHESVGLAAEVMEGSITDLPNKKAKKK